MTFSQRTAGISLLHKKETRQYKKYRPISLTNTDYQIIAFMFAKRLQNVLGNIINEHQSAYIKGRYIGETARIILDILDYCEQNNSDGILLFLDFKKSI